MQTKLTDELEKNEESKRILEEEKTGTGPIMKGDK